MRWFGQVYIPMMAVLGLLFIVLSFFIDTESIRAQQEASMMLLTGAILAAGACIGGAIQQGKS
jgi:hypothetical protein